MKRREIVKKTGVSAVAMAMTRLELPLSPKPSIVFFMADDLGYGHLGCYGQDKIQTPNIDRMSREGMRFGQTYSGCSVCTPSRSVLMTGLHMGHTSVRSNDGGVPLNNSPWLLYRFGELRHLADENERLKGIEEIISWTNPGPGGFYDDLGDPSSQPHLVRGPRYGDDPGFLSAPLVSFVLPKTGPAWPWSWRNSVEALYDAPIHLRYTGLDATARYRIRISYAGEESPTTIRIVADDRFEIHPFRKKDWPARPVEFEIPEEAMRDGQLNLKWYRTPGLSRGTNCQVSEVWLIKQ